MSPDEAFALLQRWWSPAPVIEGSPEVRDRAARLATVGRENILAARATRDQRLAASAAALYSRAIASFSEARAMLDATRPESGSVAVEPAAIVTASTDRRLSEEQKADAVLLIKEPPSVSGLPGRRRRRALVCLERVAIASGRALQPLSDREVFWLRLRRQLSVVMVPILAAWALAFWIRSPHNVARGKPVTASSVRMGTAQSLTNGAIEWGTFGLHTMPSGREWATIDLLQFYSLDFAEIYSRGDARFEFNLPLWVETSADGTNFKQVGSCKDVFTQATPCVVQLHKERARYVRVSAPEIVLSEVEVFGK
jgi:hypothetical protein